MIRKKKLYSRPRKPFELARIRDEDNLVREFGLKNKREIWKALAKVNYYRGRAKALAKKSNEEQEVLFSKLKALGLKASTIADILDFKVEDILHRRLPTIVAKKGLAHTPRHARQLVAHKKILVNGKVINSPSYLVPLAFEDTIAIKTKVKKEKPVEQTENPGESA